SNNLKFSTMNTQTTNNEQSKNTEKKANKPTEKRLSFEAWGDKLFKEDADQAKIIRTFTKLYKEREVTDKEFIKKRAAIYMNIAKKRQPSKKEA
ncbi:unnamed protein product, partial [marine sediment metagenome]